MDKDLTLAIAMLRRAINDPGSHPRYHFEQMEKLKRDWPTLWSAIQEVLKYGN